MTTVLGVWQAITITTENKMRAQDGKNLGFLTLEDGGRASDRLTHAERAVERTVREMFFAMEGKNKNLHNVAEGITHPVRMLVRRFKDAKRARRDAVNYQQSKRVVRALDIYVDALYQARTEAASEQARHLRELPAFRRGGARTTGDHPRAA